MSKSVKIPTDRDPFVVTVNGMTYSYRAGAFVTVDDAVAEVIEHYEEMKPKTNAFLSRKIKISKYSFCNVQLGYAYKVGHGPISDPTVQIARPMGNGLIGLYGESGSSGASKTFGSVDEVESYIGEMLISFDVVGCETINGTNDKTFVLCRSYIDVDADSVDENGLYDATLYYIW